MLYDNYLHTFYTPYTPHTHVLHISYRPTHVLHTSTCPTHLILTYTCPTDLLQTYTCPTHLIQTYTCPTHLILTHLIHTSYIRSTHILHMSYTLLHQQGTRYTLFSLSCAGWWWYKVATVPAVDAVTGPVTHSSPVFVSLSTCLCTHTHKQTHVISWGTVIPRTVCIGQFVGSSYWHTLRCVCVCVLHTQSRVCTTHTVPCVYYTHSPVCVLHTLPRVCVFARCYVTIHQLIIGPSYLRVALKGQC